MINTIKGKSVTRKIHYIEIEHFKCIVVPLDEINKDL